MKMDKIEMSLDDIIKSNKKRPGNNNRTSSIRKPGQFKKNSSPKKFGGIIKGRGARGGITRNNKYTRGDVNSAWKHDMFEGARKAGTAAGGLTTSRVLGGTTKLIVGNLDFSVSDTDINELFQEFGPLKTAAVHYDRSGRSLGSADVIFERRNDALKAMKTYNGVPLDGRPMNIQLATSEVPQAGTRLGFPKPASNNSTQRSPRKPIGGGGGFRGGRGRQGGFSRGRGGSGAGGRGGGRNGPKKTEVTLDQLNAELDAYTMQG